MTSFVAESRLPYQCGTNGLPLTPNSVAILGRAQRLAAVDHPGLVAFLDCARGKHERVVAVQSWHPRSLSDATANVDVRRLGKEVASALDHLHANGLVHATLQTSNVLLDSFGRAKLFNYGVGHMTGYGRHVAFPIFDPRFTAPEVLLRPPISADQADGEDGGEEPSSEESSGGNGDSPRSLVAIAEEEPPPYDPRCDVWSLGVVLASLALGLSRAGPWAGLKVSQVLRKVISLAGFQGSVLGTVAHLLTQLQLHLPPSCPRLQTGWPRITTEWTSAPGSTLISAGSWMPASGGLYSCSFNDVGGLHSMRLCSFSCSPDPEKRPTAAAVADMFSEQAAGSDDDAASQKALRRRDRRRRAETAIAFPPLELRLGSTSAFN